MARSRHAIARASVVTRAMFWNVRRARFPGVAVLCYHGIRPDGLPEHTMAFEGLHVRRSIFAAHIAALAATCDPISLDDWRHALVGRTALPPRPVHVTFDDGYRSVLQEALPVLERHGVPATVFLCSGAAARNERWWYDAVALTAGVAAVAELKNAGHDEWVRGIECISRTLSGIDDPHTPLSPTEVAQLAAHPLIEIGGHTENHPILSRASADVQRREIDGCAAAIEQWAGKPMRAFAYPNGCRGVDFTAATMGLAQAAGAEMAFGTDSGFAKPTADALALPRFVMTADVTAAHLLHRLSRVWQ